MSKIIELRDNGDVAEAYKSYIINGLISSMLWRNKYPEKWLAAAQAGGALGGEDVVIDGRVHFGGYIDMRNMEEDAVQEFLKFSGLDDAAIQNIREVQADGAVDHIEMSFEPHQTFTLAGLSYFMENKIKPVLDAAGSVSFTLTHRVDGFLGQIPTITPYSFKKAASDSLDLQGNSATSDADTNNVLEILYRITDLFESAGSVSESAVLYGIDYDEVTVEIVLEEPVDLNPQPYINPAYVDQYIANPDYVAPTDPTSNCMQIMIVNPDYEHEYILDANGLYVDNPAYVGAPKFIENVSYVEDMIANPDYVAPPDPEFIPNPDCSQMLIYNNAYAGASEFLVPDVKTYDAYYVLTRTTLSLSDFSAFSSSTALSLLYDTIHIGDNMINYYAQDEIGNFVEPESYAGAIWDMEFGFDKDHILLNYFSQYEDPTGMVAYYNGKYYIDKEKWIASPIENCQIILSKLINFRVVKDTSGLNSFINALLSFINGIVDFLGEVIYSVFYVAGAGAMLDLLVEAGVISRTDFVNFRKVFKKVSGTIAFIVLTFGVGEALEIGAGVAATGGSSEVVGMQLGSEIAKAGYSLGTATASVGGAVEFLAANIGNIASVASAGYGALLETDGSGYSEVQESEDVEDMLGFMYGDSAANDMSDAELFYEGVYADLDDPYEEMDDMFS